jgi:ABC-type phosphate/phosphonate transport system permease subunit
LSGGRWLAAALLGLVLASFWSLDLQWAQFFSLDAARSMGRFLGEFFPPDTSPGFLRQVAQGLAETLAMSALGTLLAAIAGLALSLPVQALEPEAFVDLPDSGPTAPDLRRFSRYWRQAEPLVWRQAGG